MSSEKTISPAILLALVLLLAISTAQIVPYAQAVSQSGPATWSPFGPRMNRLEITVYSDYLAMFQAFVDGRVDITDWPVPSQDHNSYASNPDFWLSKLSPEGGPRWLDINHHNPILGISQQENRASDPYDSPSTKQPTQAGIEFRRGVAHLVDKLAAVNITQINSITVYNDIRAVAWQGLVIGGVGNARLPASVLAEDCAEHPWFAPCSVENPPVSAYNLVADIISGDMFSGGHSFANLGYPGVEDLRAACDHFVAAGVQITPAGSGCGDAASGTADLVSGGQKIIFYIRSDPLGRKAWGQIFADGLNYLFDQQVVSYGWGCPPDGFCAAETYYTLSTVGPIVFGTEPDRNDWHFYTGGSSAGTYPDHLWGLYHSQFASSACGGPTNAEAVNYDFYCSPAFDQETDAGMSAMTLSGANLHFSNAALIGHRELMAVPMFNIASRWVALNGWEWQPESSLVLPVFPGGFGAGDGFWSFLNMRQLPGYMSSDPRYLPGGGDPTLIRRGFSQLTYNLSPFHYLTVWDWEVIEQVHDSLLKVGPPTGGFGVQLVDWMTTRHSQSYNPNEVIGSFTGITTQTWYLRNDLRWHDGTPVTADDVAFSIMSYRDVLSTNLQSSVFNVLTATALNPNTIQVKLAGFWVGYELDIGGLPIISHHKWGTYCNWPVGRPQPSPATLAASQCGDPAFDPMDVDGAGPGTTGITVGSGPWACLHLATYAVGGSCTRDASGAISGQSVGVGGKIVLSANNDYMRIPRQESSFHKLSWADKNNDARVDIVDIADLALHYGNPDPYWNTGENALAPIVGTDPERVDIGELATVAFYFDHGLAQPWLPSQLDSLDPDIDPFF